MNKEALFSDGTGDYVVPSMPQIGEEVSIFFRTGKDEQLCVYLMGEFGTQRMRKVETRGEFSYFETKVSLEDYIFSYYFRIEEDEEVCFYNRCGVANEVIPDYSFEIIPGFVMPKWSMGAVMYQIYVDRFYNGDSSNDVEDNEYYYIGDYSRQVKNWHKLPESSMGIREFYGGDLKGILDKLDYLQDLGIEVLYLNPIFTSPSNHKYDTQDYESVDPHYGVIAKDGGENLTTGDTQNKNASKYKKRTALKENIEASNQLFETLVTQLHKRGMKIILDGVFNHCGSFNRWLDREKIYQGLLDYPEGAYLSYTSPYHDFFHFFQDNPSDWPDNGSYNGWWGHDTLPKLNYEKNSKLETKILSIGKKWVDAPYCADGWRLDVAADLGESKETNHNFWKKFRQVVKHVNPETLILAEHYGDPKEWLQGDEWDTVMNYDAFMEPVSWFLTGLEKHSDEKREELKGNDNYFVGAMKHHMSRMPVPSLYTAMNQLSNHDHSRFLTRTNSMVGRAEFLGPKAAEEFVKVEVLQEAVIIQMTWVGSPTLYYGDEAGLCGFTDPDNRRAFPWGRENKELIAFHKKAIAIHKEHEALKIGSIYLLYSEQDVLAYGRFTREEQIVVIINNKEKLTTFTIPVWQIGIPRKAKLKRLLYSYPGGFVADEDEYIVREGEVVLNMGPHSAIILKRAED